MPSGSKPGERRGGRKKGTPNRHTKVKAAVADKVITGGVSPLEMIVETARDLWAAANAGPVPNLTKRMQACMMAEKALPYLHPRLANTTVNATVRRDPSDYSDAELAALAGAGSADGGSDGTLSSTGRPH